MKKVTFVTNPKELGIQSYDLWVGVIALILISIVWQFNENGIIAGIDRIKYKLTKKPLYSYMTADSTGVPVQIRDDGNTYYNPLFIARQAQKDYKNIADDGSKLSFLRCTDWLLQNSKRTEDISLNNYSFDCEEYNLKTPWASALTQAVIANVAFDRFKLDHDRKWLDYSQASLRSLVPDKTTMSFKIYPNGIWFEEYPSPEIPFVLNGMMATLIELHDYTKATSDSLSNFLFWKGYNALIIKLPAFDFYGFSNYDLVGNTTNRLYHQKHIEQLEAIHKIKHNDLLDTYLERWSFYDSLPLPVQLFLNPRWRRIVGFLFTWIMLFVVLNAIGRIRYR